MKTFQHYKNFVMSKQEPDAALNGVVIFHVDEEGRDWYALQETFRDDTIKIGYNAQGIVCTVSPHVYALCPTRLSIAEVASLPEHFVLEYGAYEYLSGEVVPRIPPAEEITAAAEERRKQLMSAISVELATLEDIAASGTGTTQEGDRLAALKQYRMALMRLDITQPWPALPDVA